MKRLYLIVFVMVLLVASTTPALACGGCGFKKPPVVAESVNASSDSWLNTVLKKLGFDSN